MGNAPLNVVQVIPLGAEDEMVVSIQVVTRAQAKENLELKLEEPEQATVRKRKHKSWRERKAHLVATKLKEEEVKRQ